MTLALVHHGAAPEIMAAIPKWLGYLIAQYPGWSFFTPAYSYQSAVPPADVVRVTLSQLKVCDGIVLVGPRIPSMAAVEHEAGAAGKFVLDLTQFGLEPPEDLLGGAA